MIFRKAIHIMLLFLPFALGVLCAPGCAKEYSYEGQDTTINQDTTTIPDTTIIPVIEFPVCSACVVEDSSEIAENMWSFKYGNNYLCGVIDTAIVNADRTGFTFFGPSTCSIDTGLIITAFISPAVLNGDKFNLTINRAAFEYYDNVKPSDVFVSKSIKQFSLTIDSYTHATRLAAGTFTGYVYTEDGKEAFIVSGKFKVKLM